MAEIKSRISGTSKEKEVIERKYQCTMEYPLYLEKHHWNTIWLTVAHVFGVQGVIMMSLGILPLSMILFILPYGIMAGSGTTIGCHRLWAHKTFKAKLPLQIILMFCQTAAAQYPIFKWCRDHRLHHKYVETDADPHNAEKGFFFAHMGWLFEKEHPAMKEKEKTMDFSDLDNDPVVRFQTKYYWILLFICVFVVPMSFQHWMWPQLTFYQLFCANYVWYCLTLHCTWLVNSAAHLHGYKPYDSGIRASENRLVSLLAIGEGWHNYHHVFPWDYKAAELGFYRLNWSTMIIDFFAWVGWAYDLKTVPEHVVKQRVARTGTEDLHEWHHTHSHSLTLPDYSQRGKKDAGDEPEVLPPWGWGDKDIPLEHFQITQFLRASKGA